jgi:hypothetical protein
MAFAEEKERMLKAVKEAHSRGRQLKVDPVRGGRIFALVFRDSNDQKKEREGLKARLRTEGMTVGLALQKLFPGMKFALLPYYIVGSARAGVSFSSCLSSLPHYQSRL